MFLSPDKVSDGWRDGKHPKHYELFKEAYYSSPLATSIEDKTPLQPDIVEPYASSTNDRKSLRRRPTIFHGSCAKIEACCRIYIQLEVKINMFHHNHVS
ncbi:hypothetical protein DKX38_027815 [Salix brachista]|uniref:Uncharacterized protein n=1 Tax=Salix brachista TaxID=2182728 RepID=A0A5N5J405_9ROSI|nr:hypothetical protein DKX38_027815 [Salix brachista]